MQKTIKEIDVKMTFKVGLGDIKVPLIVFNQLKALHDHGQALDMTSCKYPEAIDWVTNKINISDCYDAECEVTEFETD